MSQPDLPRLRLKKNEERRLRAGHLWVYSNEIDTQATPLKAFQPGDSALIEDNRGQVMGVALVNPGALISARLLSRDADHRLERSLVVHRLQIAESLRQRFYSAPYYRWVHGDSDGLPGLVVDRFGDIIVVQPNTAGMERALPEVVQALIKVASPAGILVRRDSSARAQEGLPEAEPEVVHGEVPDEVMIEENGVRFYAPVKNGQKTGWFYDHRDNRARLSPLVRGLRVLDVFSYAGSWGIQAAVQGAGEVVCIDSSASALALVQRNAELNQVADRVRTIEDDAFEAMKKLIADGEKFDVVIIDPPALIKRKKDHEQGMKAYRHLNELAIRLLNRDALLLSASCSMHLTTEELRNILRGAARHLDRHAQILWQGHQSADHPVLPAITETEYLKAFCVRVLPSGL